jgi:hypothetical protein
MQFIAFFDWMEVIYPTYEYAKPINNFLMHYNNVSIYLTSQLFLTEKVLVDRKTSDNNFSRQSDSSIYTAMSLSEECAGVYRSFTIVFRLD